jgi:hypothetical protein
MKRLLIAIACVSLAACGTGYKRFYTPMAGATPDKIAEVRANSPLAQPLVDHTGMNGEQMVKAYGAQGYGIIGYSDFTGSGNQADAGAIEQAKAIGADLVVISNPQYQGERSAVIPITTPTTSTSYTTGSATAYGSGGSATAYGSAITTTYGQHTNYVPISVSRYEYAAAYFVKLKVRFGAGVRELTDEQRQELQSNHGVQVLSIINGSPAYEKDILVGDILLAFDGTQIDGVQGWNALIKQHAGQTVAVKIYRNGMYMTKDVTLNP